MRSLAPYCCAAALLLAGCSRGEPVPLTAQGVDGSTLQAIRGASSGGSPLLPEAGDIWKEGLQTSPTPGQP